MIVVGHTCHELRRRFVFIPRTDSVTERTSQKMLEIILTEISSLLRKGKFRLPESQVEMKLRPPELENGASSLAFMNCELS
jgi:hypothetical protein